MFHLSRTTTVWVCGDSNPELGGPPLYAEFDLIDAASRKSFFTVGALENGEFKQEGPALVFTAFRKYPIGSGFKWINVPFQRMRIKRSGAEYTSSCKQLFFRSHFSAEQLKIIWGRYEAAKHGGHIDEDMTELPVLAVMDGDKRYDLDAMAADLRLDAAFAEDFGSVRGDYEDIKNGDCGLAVRPLGSPP